MASEPASQSQPATETVAHLPFDASRTYTGRYRYWFYQHHSDAITGRVLDVGAGSGWNTDQYDHINGIDEYITLDIDRGPSLDLHADATTLPVQTDSVDTVILSAVLEHIPVTDVPRVLDEARRVLRPGGTLLAGVPHQYPLHSEPHDYWRPTTYGLTHLLTDAGFGAEHITCYRGGCYSEVLLHALFYPLRAIALYVGVRQAAWLFAPLHYLVCLVARFTATALSVAYGENPFGGRWYLQNFVIADTHHE